jgi:hypothetical protein
VSFGFTDIDADEKSRHNAYLNMKPNKLKRRLEIVHVEYVRKSSSVFSYKIKEV